VSCTSPIVRELSAFAMGELDEERSRDVLDHVEACASCSRELDLLADLVRLEAEPRALQSTRGEGRTAALPRKRPWRWARRIAVAAALLLLALGLFDRAFDPSGGAVRPADLAALADRSLPSFVAAELRGPEAGLASEFELAMQGWQGPDLGAVESSLTRFLDAHPDHAPARFYRGVARRDLDRLDEARADLRSAVDRAQGPLREHALWCLAQTELLSGDAESAREALRTLRDSGGDYAECALALEERLAR